MKVTPETQRRLVRFGKRVRHAMDRRGLNIHEVARALEINRRNLQRILRGEQNVTMDMMVRLRRVLRVRLVVDFT